MRIMGVDPGTLVTGYGVIDYEPGKIELVEYDVIRTKPAMSMPIRLREIHTKLVDVIARTLPDEFAIESAFYSKNVQSTLKLGHARGVAILAAVLRDIPTAEYSPREVKLAVTGNGGAAKEQVEYMVMAMLKLTERHDFLDATDALAIALCHGNRLLGREGRPARPQSKSQSKSRGWKQFVLDNPDRSTVND